MFLACCPHFAHSRAMREGGYMWCNVNACLVHVWDNWGNDNWGGKGNDNWGGKGNDNWGSGWGGQSWNNNNKAGKGGNNWNNVST